VLTSLSLSLSLSAHTCAVANQESKARSPWRAPQSRTH